MGVGTLVFVYAERRSAVAGAVVWTGRSDPTDGPGLVLPDGCMDLLWHDGELLVAGPDTVAHASDRGPRGDRWTGLRLAPGHAPVLLGVPAVELRDRRVPLADVWPVAQVRELTERVGTALDPGRALEAVVAARRTERDPALAHVVELLARGRSVAEVSDELGEGPRRLHRRSLAAFGYGPKVLGRILRLQSALRAVRSGRPAAEVAAEAGYADQAHFARDVKALTGTTLRHLLR